MDIHPPHAPIRSIRDFLLQIFTVTCGIIIALGLEGAIEWQRDATLAQITRDDFRSELNGNLHELQQEVSGWKSDFAWMQTMVSYGEAKLRHEPQKPPAPITNRSFVLLSNAAWDTALATQAMHRLRVAEARQLADAYNKQASLNDLIDHAVHQWVSMAAFGEDLETMPEADTRAALGGLRVAAAYAGSMLAGEEKVVSSYQAALKALAD